MMQLFDSPFSPFARKVRLVLEFKQLEFEAVDALRKDQHDSLRKANSRGEVPALLDADVLVINSSDIVQYLDYRYPQVPVYPAEAKMRVAARSWERTADTFVDPILTNISYWQWAERPDTMPDGLIDKARDDIHQVFREMEKALAKQTYLCGQMSIAEFALFPHMASTKALGVGFAPDSYPNLWRWFKALRSDPLFAADLKRTADYLANIEHSNVEREKIFWRGERIEWLLSRGYHGWFMDEIAADRVAWPGPALTLVDE